MIPESARWALLSAIDAERRWARHIIVGCGCAPVLPGP